MENREYFLQVIDISIADATASGIQVSNQRFNSSYDRLEGVALIEKNAGGNANQYEVGFEFPTDNETVRTVNHALYEFGAACPMSDRFQKIGATAKGADFTVSTRLLVAATDALDYQLILKLSRPKPENC